MNTLIIGWPTIALLAQGHSVTINNITLIPDDLLFNTNQQIKQGEFSHIIDQDVYQLCCGALKPSHESNCNEATGN